MEGLISVVGLGYVGLPLAVTFAERGVKVIGFDVNDEKINLYKNNIDPTHEVGNERLSKVEGIEFTSDAIRLKQAKFHIVAVPTPIREDKVPNLYPVESATRIVGQNLMKGSIVVFESTVYPGVTEEICVPILEQESGLIYGKDFKVGYSPERINPGDKVHTVENIVKIVSGMDEQSLDIIAKTYEIVIDAGVHRAPSIKVAEAAKVIENSQRDINIAFMNELSMIFDKMGIDTNEVIEAAATKWNFLKFYPGLVGGHCIGVDPYYLTYKAQQLGYKSEIILSGRRVNDNMGKFIAEKTIKRMIASDIKIKDATVLIMGLTFKENVPDLRNSKVEDVIYELKEYGVNVLVTDAYALSEEAVEEYGINLLDLESIENVHAVIVAVPHKEYVELSFDKLIKLYDNNVKTKILIDVKGIYDKLEAEKTFDYWRL
ncbi:MAG: nucleotide sugar dehydrogenase [Firmicutes bacterium HGW-Firmicutes-7]|nr:MAG: nucleotide sugar dehydrogenase [Firmicutes bacterium HGW-Firmicutes-7]